jgi:hypothetical protein
VQLGQIVKAQEGGFTTQPPITPSSAIVVGAVAGVNVTDSWAYSVIEIRLAFDWNAAKSVYLDMRNTTLWSSTGGYEKAEPLIAEAPYLGASKPYVIAQNGNPAVMASFRSYYLSKQRQAGGGLGSGGGGGGKSIVAPVAGTLAAVAVLGATQLPPRLSCCASSRPSPPSRPHAAQHATLAAAAHCASTCNIHNEPIRARAALLSVAVCLLMRKRRRRRAAAAAGGDASKALGSGSSNGLPSGVSGSGRHSYIPTSRSIRAGPGSNGSGKSGLEGGVKREASCSEPATALIATQRNGSGTGSLARGAHISGGEGGGDHRLSSQVRRSDGGRSRSPPPARWAASAGQDCRRRCAVSLRVRTACKGLD